MTLDFIQWTIFISHNNLVHMSEFHNAANKIPKHMTQFIFMTVSMTFHSWFSSSDFLSIEVMSLIKAFPRMFRNELGILFVIPKHQFDLNYSTYHTALKLVVYQSCSVTGSVKGRSLFCSHLNFQELAWWTAHDYTHTHTFI